MEIECFKAEVKNRLCKWNKNIASYDEYFNSKEWKNDVQDYFEASKRTSDYEKFVERLANFIFMNY